MSDNKKRLDEAMAQFQREAAVMTEKTKRSGIDWTKANVAPKDVSFKMGPMLTEAQFKEYCEQTGTTPHIFRK
jgi:hypothetical protein